MSRVFKRKKPFLEEEECRQQLAPWAGPPPVAAILGVSLDGSLGSQSTELGFLLSGGRCPSGFRSGVSVRPRTAICPPGEAPSPAPVRRHLAGQDMLGCPANKRWCLAASVSASEPAQAVELPSESLVPGTQQTPKREKPVYLNHKEHRIKNGNFLLQIKKLRHREIAPFHKCLLPRHSTSSKYL